VALVVLSMVSLIVVLSHGRLRATPDKERDKISSFHSHGLKRFTLALTCLCSALSSDSYLEASLGGLPETATQRGARVTHSQ